MPFEMVVVPQYGATSPDHTWWAICRVSSRRSKRSFVEGKGTPKPRASRSNQPAPLPRYALPPESTPSVVAVLKRMPG